MGNDHYPPGTFELPGEKEKLRTYIFEVGGEIEVEAYSEEGAEIKLQNEIKDLLYHAWLDGNIEII